MKSRNIYLWQLILMIALLTLMLTLLSSIIVSYQMNKETLIDASQQESRAYAQKLADTIDMFMANVLDSFVENTKEILPFMGSIEYLNNKTNELHVMSKLFNTVFITNTRGEIIASSPEVGANFDIYLDEPTFHKTMDTKRVTLSDPFLSETGEINVSIMHPLVGSTGRAFGVLGGTISLQKKEFLGTILGNHFYYDGSYVYVINKSGKVLYHPDSSQLLNDIQGNEAVAKLMKGQSGVDRVINYEGQEMLVGYAYINSLQWGIVSQRPLEIALSPLKDTLVQMILFTVPVAVIVLILVWSLTMIIARPLNKLASVADQSVHLRSGENIEKVSVWYYESTQLKDAIFRSIEQLRQRVERYKQESALDYLTGLYNRRYLSQQLEMYEQDKTPYYVIFIDIDRFKRINDNYGHVVGDEVLQFLAEEIRELLGHDSYGYRYGGEEFCIVLPNASEHNAYDMAEKLRSTLEMKRSPSGEIMTISVGLAAYPQHTDDYYDVINQADAAMYVAKRAGGNRIAIAEQLETSQ